MTQYSFILAAILFMQVLFLGRMIQPSEGKSLEVLSKEDFWSSKLQQGSYYDFVALGDSRVYRGFDPRVFEKAYNFGFSSQQLVPEYLESSLKLFREDGEKTLIIGVTAHSLINKTGSHRKILQKEEERISFLELRGLKSFISDPTGDLSLFFQRVELAERKETKFFFYNNGFSGTYTSKINPNRALASYQDTFSKHQFQKERTREVAAKISDLVQRGIKVFFYIPPVPDGMKELERSMGKFDEEYVIKSFMQAGAKYIPVLDSYTSYDGSHILETEAIRLTKNIKKYIEETNI